MKTYSLDTNCLVAAALASHEHHDETLQAIMKLESDGYSALIVGHALAEAYAVLTRLPAPVRLSGAMAYAALEAGWSSQPIRALPEAAYWPLLHHAATTSVAGGRFYDTLLAATASDAGVAILLTWNRRHFLEPGHGDMAILTPSDVLEP